MMTDTETLVPLKIVAEWQVLGEGPEGGELDVEALMKDILNEAKDDKKIDNYEILLVSGSGLQFVLFTVDLRLHRALLEDKTPIEVRDRFETLLNNVVGDTDVQVRWVSRLSNGS